MSSVVRRAPVLGCVWAFVAGASCALASAIPVSSSAQIVAALNRERVYYGLPAVRESRSFSAGCAAHDKYLIRNGTHYLLRQSGHFEDPRRPGYTKAGDVAARHSVLDYGTGAAWAYGDPWDDAAFHVFQLLNPAVAIVGADERPMTLSDGRRINLECLDTFGGPFRRPPAKLHVYIVPRNGSVVPTFTYNGEPEPVLGTPAFSYGPPIVFTYLFGGVNHVRFKSLTGKFNGQPIKILAAYAGGASGPSRAATAAAGGSAGFYSPGTADAVSPDRHGWPPVNPTPADVKAREQLTLPHSDREPYSTEFLFGSPFMS